jgi:hypothetical protein
MTSLTDQQSVNNNDNTEEEKKENVNTILVIVTILVCFLCVFGVTKVKSLRKLGMSMSYRNVVVVVVVSILIGIIGLFNAEVMDTVGNQLRPILVFMSLTFTLLFTKFSSQNTSDEIITFIKKDSKLFDFILFNSALFFIIIMHVVISKYVKMNKKYIDLIQQVFTLVCFFIMLGFYHSTSTDARFTYIIICLIVFYMFRIFHKIDQIAKTGISTKLIDLSALEYDNVDFLKYIQMMFNGLFLINFFS